MITARTPAGTAGARVVSATTAGGTVSFAAGFTYMAAPTVTSIAPVSGPAAGGTLVTISGANLLGATMTVGGTSVRGIFATSTTLSATTPPGAVGTRNIVITTPGGSVTTLTPPGSAATPLVFSYAAPPTITTISPASGTTRGGTTIFLSGTNLSGATLTIDGVRATVFASSATTLAATTPPGLAGRKDVAVQTAGGVAVRSGGFTYVVTLNGDGGSPAPARGADAPRARPTVRDTDPDRRPLAPSMELCLRLLIESGVQPPPCEAGCADMPAPGGAASTDGPDGPDLDGNGMPDICQLRCGDLDLNGRIDGGDAAMLLLLIGQEPVLGVGDLDGDGQIDASDMQCLLARMPPVSADVEAGAGAGENGER
jgi:hypothetical protein